MFCYCIRNVSYKVVVIWMVIQMINEIRNRAGVVKLRKDVEFQYDQDPNNNSPHFIDLNTYRSCWSSHIYQWSRTNLFE